MTCGRDSQNIYQYNTYITTHTFSRFRTLIRRRAEPGPSRSVRGHGVAAPSGRRRSWTASRCPLGCPDHSESSGPLRVIRPTSHPVHSDSFRYPESSRPVRVIRSSPSHPAQPESPVAVIRSSLTTTRTTCAATAACTGHRRVAQAALYLPAGTLATARPLPSPLCCLPACRHLGHSQPPPFAAPPARPGGERVSRDHH